MPVTRFALFPNVIIAFAGIILFFVIFLGWIIAKDILRPILFPTPAEAASPALKNAKLLPLFGALTIIYGPFLLGMVWVWSKPAFFRIEQDAWVLRNSFWYPLLKISPETPRQIEFCLTRSLDEIGREEDGFLGDVYLYSPAVSSSSWKIDVVYVSENASGTPVLYDELGYMDRSFFENGPHKGLLSPFHIWTASGPEYLIAEKSTTIGHSENKPGGAD